MTTTADIRQTDAPLPTRPERATGAPAVLTQFVRDLASSTLTVRELLNRLADTALDLVHAEASCVLELNGETFVFVAPSGSARAFDGREFRLKDDPSLFREALTARHPVWTNEAQLDPRVDDYFRVALNTRQIAVVPIIVEDAVSGLLVCVNSAFGAFCTVDIDLLGHLGDHGALVLRSQRLVQRAELAAIDARHRAEDAAMAAHRNAVLARTARVLADSVTREGVYEGLARVLSEELHASGFAVYDANPQLRTARLEHQWGTGHVDEDAIAANFWRSGLGRAVESGQSDFIENLTDAVLPNEVDTSVALQASGFNAVALLPLIFEERPQGLLSVRYQATHRFDEDERQLLRDIATQVVVAFRNAVNLAQLERRAQRLTALARAQHQLTHVVGEDTLPQTIADAVRDVIPSAVCDIFASVKDGLIRVLTTRNGQPTQHGPVSDVELALVNETFATGVSRLAVHTDETRYWARGSSELCATVRFGGRSAGVLRLLSPEPDAFDLQDLDLLTILARQAGTAIETSRLFTLSDFQRQRAEGAAELARVTLQAWSLADGANELLTVLDRFVPSIGKAIGVARARDGLIEYVAASGTLEVLKGHRPGGNKGVAAMAPDGRPRELSSLRDVAPAALVETLPDEWGFVVPLAARDRTLGLLVVSSPRKAPLLRRDRVTLERLSTSLALALDALLLDEEERLSREREHLLATALTTIDHPIFILDRVGVRYANPAAAREYGWSQAELMEMRFEQLVLKVHPVGSQQDAPLLEDGVSLTEHVHRRHDGTEFPAAVTISPLVSQDGEQLGQVVSVRNVSSDRRIAEQLRHTEKMVALGGLVAGVAHEINNPLTGISAFAQLLLEEDLEGDQRESVQLIKQESDRAKTVIRDLLIFARKTESVTAPFDLNDMIEQTLRLRAYPLRNAGVRIELQLDGALPHVSGDPQKLQQVLLNIIANAEYAMEGRSTRVVTVGTRVEGVHAVVTVTDTGRGMPPEVRHRIFEPFFTTKAEGSGTGLGLSVSYGIIQAHGGTIDVQSDVGSGTTVTIRLPITASDTLSAADAPVQFFAAPRTTL